MKKTIRRSLALALAVLMLLTVSPMGWAVDGECPNCHEQVSFIDAPAVPATCQADGQASGLKCPKCGYYTYGGSVIPKGDEYHQYVAYAGETPKCSGSSTAEIMECSVCHKLFLKTIGADNKPVYTEKTAAQLSGHTMSGLMPANDAECGVAGNVAYYFCTACDKKFSDAQGKNELAKIETDPLNHHIVKQEAVPATCQADGTEAYWYCDRPGCGAKFSDAAGTLPIEDESLLVIDRLKNHDPEPGDEWKYFANDDGAFECNVGGYKLPLCKYCGALLEDEEYKVVVAAGDHVKADYESYFSNVEGEAFDCAKGGYKVTLCVKCGQERTPKTTVAPTVDSHGKTVHDEIVYAAVPATCTKAGISRYEKCKKCGTITSGAKEIIPSGGHTPDPVDAHEPTCTQDGNIAYYTCSVCHMASPTSDGPWYADDEDETALEKAGVIINANGHDFATQKAAKAATCTEDGNREVVKCSVSTCNQLAMVMTESEKDQEGVYKQGSRYYKNITSEAEAKLIKTDHTWVKNYEDPAYKPATCSSEGSVPAVCHCGATTTLTLEKTKHTNDDSVPVKVVAPTCERGKYETHKCKVCGQNYDIDYYDEKDPATNVDGIKPLGHIYSGQAKQVKDATCTEAGIYGRPCTRSGCDSVADMQRKPAAKGHDYQNYEQKATCTEAGFTAKKCSRCGDVINKKDIAAAGHKDDNKDAKCDVCGKILCDHICHDENIFKKFIWFIMNVWNQFLGINDTCKCGLKHYTKTSNLVVNG